MDDVKLETYHMKTMLTQSSSQLTQFYFLVPLWLYVTVMFIGHFQKKKLSLIIEVISSREHLLYLNYIAFI